MRLLLTETHLLIVEFLAGIGIVAAIVASVHVLLRRGENRSAIGWLGLFWLGYPLIGSLIYLLVGVNLIRRDKRASGKAILSRRRRRKAVRPRVELDDEMPRRVQPPMRSMHVMGDRILGNTLIGGDDVELLVNGPQVYPAMLEAIESARRSVALSSYIFKDDPAGTLFADALERARDRGVDVRVLIDALGSTHGGRSVYRLLRRRGLNARRFMPSLGLPFFRFANLRNHRKLLLVDGRVAFTGGMNIDVAFWPELRPPGVMPKEDIHFRVRGPVLADLLAAFEQDWQFMTGESFDPEVWSISGWDNGTMFARGIPDGPDSDKRLTRNFILAALAAAERSVKIVTPYFLPPSEMMSAMEIAILRGVRVELLVPAPTNSPIVEWASMDYLRKAREIGCHIWADGRPFNHSKLMVVDGRWSMIGSSNWDPRSLRLNFEFNLECHSEELASSLESYWDNEVLYSKPWVCLQRGERPLWKELRDGFARLFVPLL